MVLGAPDVRVHSRPEQVVLGENSTGLPVHILDDL
jgi:hypothetical protein